MKLDTKSVCISPHLKLRTSPKFVVVSRKIPNINCKILEPGRLKEQGLSIYKNYWFTVSYFRVRLQENFHIFLRSRGVSTSRHHRASTN